MIGFKKLLVSSLFLFGSYQLPTYCCYADKIWTPQTKIFDQHGNDDDFFGNALAIDGNTAVVGAYGKNSNKGSVYVLSKSLLGTSSYWSIGQEIVPPINLVDYGLFGHGVAVDDGIIVISAIFDDENDYGSGSIYVYEQDKDTKSWKFQQKLIAPDGEEKDFFGFSVSVKDRTIVAGAFGHVSNTGAVYTFTRNENDNKWSFSQKLTPPENKIRSHFGRNLAFDGKSIVVGAYLEDVSELPQEGSNQGSVYVYSQALEEGVWKLQQKLTTAHPTSNEYFGTMVAVQGDTIVALSGRASTISGVAYTFIYNGSTWERQEKTLSPVGGAASVAFDGNKLVIGSRNDNSGWVYSFRAARTSNSSSSGSSSNDNDDNKEDSSSSSSSSSNFNSCWKLEQKLVSNHDVGDDSSFGGSVAIQNDTILIGANGDHSFRGSVYTFNLVNVVDEIMDDDQWSSLATRDIEATVVSSLRGRRTK